MRRSSVLVLASAGCNAVFGLSETALHDANLTGYDAEITVPDRDRDGVPDPEDPCIAGIADAKTDADGDSYPNESDFCPFEYESADADGDNIYDDCDPLMTLGGDRRRCVMAFLNPTINRELWTVRDGAEDGWVLIARNGLVGSGTATLVAGERFEAPVTTSYDLTVSVNPRAPATEGALTLWLRTNVVAAASDVGCELRGGAAMSQVTLHGAATTQSMTIAQPVNRALKLQAVIMPAVAGRANVRCIARFITDFAGATVSAEVIVPSGTVGFGIVDANVTIPGMSVLERDDEPAL